MVPGVKKLGGRSPGPHGCCAYVIWNGGDKFAKVILCLGPFHTMCSFMGSMGKLMSSSGFEDILIESVYVQVAPSIKLYPANTTTDQFMLMLDAIERNMLMEMFIEMNKDEQTGNGFADLPTIGVLAGEPTRANLIEACADSSCMEFSDTYERFRDRQRERERERERKSERRKVGKDCTILAHVLRLCVCADEVPEACKTE